MKTDVIISVEEPNTDDQRKSRKIETGKSGGEEVQGRFFLKDKLCSLGLADVSLLGTEKLK